VKTAYYAVLFSNTLLDQNDLTYQNLSKNLRETAEKLPGYLGIESYRNPQDGKGITISYWKSLEAVTLWKKHADHLIAQQYGRDIAYDNYSVRVCEVQREYHFNKDPDH